MRTLYSICIDMISGVVHKKMYVMVLLFASLLVLSFSIQDAHATNFVLSDQASCVSLNGIWDPTFSECEVVNLTINAGDVLQINAGVELFNDGIIKNFGTISSSGIIDNFGTITNSNGTINNNSGGTIIQESDLINNSNGTINNSGTIINYGVVTNNPGSTIGNSDIIDNFDVITNSGIINDSCGGIVYNYGEISGSNVTRISCNQQTLTADQLTITSDHFIRLLYASLAGGWV
ncbi:MAG TPA: hypothetical protein VFG24_08760 [Nitrosopumilaceae archaeon]|nr:hypothetical protein [Nitrosopumilaceae archaeon]